MRAGQSETKCNQASSKYREPQSHFKTCRDIYTSHTDSISRFPVSFCVRLSHLSMRNTIQTPELPSSQDCRCFYSWGISQLTFTFKTHVRHFLVTTFDRVRFQVSTYPFFLGKVLNDNCEHSCNRWLFLGFRKIIKDPTKPWQFVYAVQIKLQTSGFILFGLGILLTTE